MALQVKMTAMPQMVSFFNGMGGACAAVISLVEFDHILHSGKVELGMMIVIILGLIIGSVSFSGSIIAYGKLEGKIGDKALPAGQILNIALLLGILGLGALMVISGRTTSTLYLYSLGTLSALWCVVCDANWWCRYAGCYLTFE